MSEQVLNDIQLESKAKAEQGLASLAPKEKEAPKAPVKSAATKTLEELEIESKQLELELKKLELQERKANLEDINDRLAERELKRANIRQEAYTKGATIESTRKNEAMQQNRCNHHKGGNGAGGVVGGKGDSPDYAVLMHTFANGDTWVRCLRCGKTWKPPVKSDHKTQESYNAALAIYKQAVNFQTKNTPSKGVIFQYSDGGEFYRENTKNATLR